MDSPEVQEQGLLEGATVCSRVVAHLDELEEWLLVIADQTPEPVRLRATSEGDNVHSIAQVVLPMLRQAA